MNPTVVMCVKDAGRENISHCVFSFKKQLKPTCGFKSRKSNYLEGDGLRGGTRAFWWTGNGPCLPLSGVYIGEDVGNSGSCAVKTCTLDYIQSQCLIKKEKKSPPQMKGWGPRAEPQHEAKQDRHCLSSATVL